MADIAEISNKTWDIGKQRHNIIRVLAEGGACKHNMVLEAAKTLQLSERYVYKLIHKYRKSYNTVKSFVPSTSCGGKGKSRLSNTVEILINNAIENLYLNSQRLSAVRIVEEIQRECFFKNMIPPSERTIRRRIHDLPCAELQKREQNSSNKAIEGSFPEVDYPLAAIQIDHTLVDVIIVDPTDRLPVGRPYLTVAIDVYSRCIAGFLLTFEAPSATSVGLCLTHVAMEKSHWLSVRNINASWPIHGKPCAIYVDNGAEFHSTALTRGCDQHGIQINYRPPGKTHYGGIIERIIGTLMKLVHALPGTTFSNVKERGKYCSESKACLTLSELERWITIAITKYYHVKIHKGINGIPIKHYEHGLRLMRSEQKNLCCVQNGKAFLIDFLPISHRILRRDGFRLDHINYYNNALRTFIAERSKYGKFLIRRDPRDLSRIYVSLPEEQGYLEVPYRALHYPAISLFEHRIALKRLKSLHKQQVGESALFKAIEEMRDIAKKAESETRSARRNRERLKENKKVQTKAVFAQTKQKCKSQKNDISPFSNIEVWK